MTATTAAIPTVTDIAHVLATFWAAAIGVDAISEHENLFDRGGGSLTLIAVLSNAQDHWHTQIPLETVLATFFESPTLAALASIIHECLRQANQVASP